MTIEAARLAVVVDADTKGGEDGLNRMHGLVGGAGKAFGLAAAAAGGFGVAVGVFAAKSAMGLEDAWAPVGTLLGANTAQFGEMKSAMTDFVSNSPSSANDIGMASYMALSAGITGTKNVTDALTASQQLASAGLGDIGGSMDLVTSAMNSFTGEHLTADQAAKMFFGTVASGKTTTAELAQGFGQLAPMAAGMGVKFGDLLAATASMTSTGMSASVAYSGIRGALTAIVAPTADAAKTAEKLGINFSQAHLKAVGLPAFLQEVKDKTGGNVETMASLFSGVEGLNAVMALTGPQADSFAKNLTGIGTAGDNLSARATEMENTTSNRFAEMKNKAMVALGGIGEKVIGYLLPKLTEAQTWVTAHWPQISKTFHEVADAVIEAWETKGRPVFDKIIEIGKVVVGWVVDHWPQISTSIGEVMSTIQDVVSNVLDLIQTIWKNYGDKILGAVEIVWSYIRGAIESAMNLIKGVIDLVMGLIHGDWGRVWDGIKEIFKGIWEQITSIVRVAIDSVKLVLSAAWKFIKDAVSTAWDGIFDVIIGSWNLIIGFFTGLPSKIGHAIAGMWDGIKDAFKSAVNWIIDKWNNFHIPGLTVAGVKITPQIDFPDIPRFHGGGLVPGPIGSEQLALLQGGEMVYTARQQAALATSTGGGGGHTTIINVGSGAFHIVAAKGNEELVGREVAKALLRYENESGRIYARVNQSIIG